MRDSQIRSHLWVALKFVFAALILALVMSQLPWRDELSLADGAGRHHFVGTVIGDWKSDHVRFEFDADHDRTTLPAFWQTQLAGSDSLELFRSPEVEWKPGMPRVFRSVEALGLVLAFVLLFIGVLGQTTRWWRLLAAVGCPTGWFNALRLNLYGLFFNLVVPGLTGGDLVKAVLVAREYPERRAAAAASVLVDRLVGLLMLALLGAVAILWEGDKFAAARNPVLIALFGGVAIALLYVNPALRRAFNYTRWLERMPMSRSVLQIDEAFLAYSRRPLELLLAAVLSVWNHAFVALAIFVLGRAFGDTALSFVQYVAISSIGNIASALPIAPGGWGVGEAVYQYLFESIGANGTIGVAVSITFKLLFTLIGLCGGVYLLLPGGRRHMTAVRQTSIRSAGTRQT